MVAGRTGGAGNRAKSAHSLRLASCLPDTRVLGVFRRSIRRDAATDSRNDNPAPPRNLRMCGSRGGFGKTEHGRCWNSTVRRDQLRCPETAAFITFYAMHELTTVSTTKGTAD